MALPGQSAAHMAHACPAEGVFVPGRVIEAQQGGKRGPGLADVQSGATRKALSRALFRGLLPRGEGLFRAGWEIEVLIGGKPLRQGGECGEGPAQDIFGQLQVPVSHRASPFVSVRINGGILDFASCRIPALRKVAARCDSWHLFLSGIIVQTVPLLYHTAEYRPCHPLSVFLS